MGRFDKYLTASTSATPEPEQQTQPEEQQQSRFAKYLGPQSRFSKYLHGATDVVDSPLRHAARSFVEAARKPAAAVDAVLGAPQRFVAGTIAHIGAGDNGTLGLGNGLYDAFHPNDSSSDEAAMEHRLHVDRLKTNDSDPTFLGKVRNFAVDMGAQTLTDPLTYLGVGAVRSGLRALAKAPGIARAADAASPVVDKVLSHPQVSNAVRFFREGHDIKQGATAAGVAHIKGIETATENAFNSQRERALEVARQHQPELEAYDRGEGEFPQAVKAEFQRLAYLAGSPSVRRAALKAGYVPTRDEQLAPHLNVLTAFKEDYVPKQAIFDKEADTLLPGQERTLRRGQAGYNLRQGAGDETSPAFERVVGRLTKEYNDTRDATKQRAILNAFGLNPEIDIQRTVSAIEQTSDPQRKLRLESLLERQKAEMASRAERYNALIKPAAMRMEGVKDLGSPGETARMTPEDARMQAARELGFVGNRPVLHVDPVTGEEIVRSVPQQFASPGKKVEQSGHGFDPTGTIRSTSVKGVTDPEEIARIGEMNRRKNMLKERTDQILQRHNRIIAPQFLLDRAFKDATIQQAGKWPILSTMSEALKDAMFVNPLPHVKNIMTLQMEGVGGEKTLARGTAIFSGKGMTQQQFAANLARLDRMGARSNFFKQRDAAIDQFIKDHVPVVGSTIAQGYGKLRNLSHDALWRYDASQRVALLEHLDKDVKYAHLSDFEKGQVINDTLFDYVHQSPAAQALKQLGAPFPHWRIGNIARQGQAIVENPGGVERIARGENTANEDVLKNEPYKMELNTPVDEAEKFFNPQSTTQYAVTTAGPLLQIPWNFKSQGDLQDVANRGVEGVVSDAARAYVPMASPILDAAGVSKFPSKAPAPARAALGLIGGYFSNDPSLMTKLIQYLKEHGLTQSEAQSQARTYMRYLYH